MQPAGCPGWLPQSEDRKAKFNDYGCCDGQQNQM
jgi:hypothetical protein